MAFLRHVRRARVLVHVVDGSGLEGDPFEAFQAIDAELGAFSADLLDRPRIVAFNKVDLQEARELWPDFEALVLAEGYEAVAVSAASGVGLRELVGRTVGMLAEAPPAPRPQPDETPVLRPTPVDEPAQLFRRSDGVYVVRDPRLERLASKLNFETADAAGLLPAATRPQRRDGTAGTGRNSGRRHGGRRRSGIRVDGSGAVIAFPRVTMRHPSLRDASRHTHRHYLAPAARRPGAVPAHISRVSSNDFLLSFFRVERLP